MGGDETAEEERETEEGSFKRPNGEGVALRFVRVDESTVQSLGASA